MSLVDGLRYRLWTALHPAAWRRAALEEQAHHLDLDSLQQEDRSAALRRYGNRTRYGEERRHAAGLDLLDDGVRDARHLLRSLRRSPGFAAMVVLTLALGIGLTTLLVSLTDHVVLRALPFREPSRLMMLLERDDHGGRRTPSYPTARDWQRDSAAAQVFEGITYIRGDAVQLCLGQDCERTGDAFVEPAFFPLLGARPVLGRTLLPEDQNSGTPVAVLSWRLWQQRFGGDRAVLGRTVVIDSVATTVVGVLPVGAVYPPFAQVWQPISGYRHREILEQRGFHADSRTMGRLRSGMDSAQATAAMRTVGARLARAYPAEQAGWTPTMLPVRQELLGNVGTILWALSGAATLLLLLACANVAALLLARTTTRGRELALRSAIGASRWRIIRQLLTESLVLSLLGGGVGAFLGAWGVRLSRTLLATRLPRMDELQVDWRVIAVAAGATVFTALLCGIWPALLATRNTGVQLGGGSRSEGSPGVSRRRRVLVTAQFALALVLLVGAGLLVQSFRRAAGVDVGFDASGLLALRINPPSSYAGADQAAALYARLMKAATSVPGVTDAAFINHAPFGGAAMPTTISIPGRTELDSSNQVFYRTASRSYLSTMRMTLRQGRWFDDADMRARSAVFVINQSLARRYWPGASAVGQRMTVTRASQARSDFGEPVSGTVIGVVGDVLPFSLDAGSAPEVYVPYTLETWPWGSLMVRARNDRAAIPALVRAIRSVDPRLIREGVAGTNAFQDMQELVQNSLQPRLLTIKFIGSFALCALILAAIGMYGVVAFGIAQRTREIGVRKALGADNGSIAALILGESSRVILIGAAAGTAGAWAGARLIRGMLFQTGVLDLATYGTAIALLAAVALAATFLPLRRATRLDPAVALRGE